MTVPRPVDADRTLSASEGDRSGDRGPAERRVQRPGSSPAPGAGFEEILAAAQLGVEWALTVLYREHQPGLLAYLRAHAPGEAEDLASEVWIDVARALPGFEGGADGFRRLLFTVGRRRVIDHGRKQVRRRTDPTDVDALSAIAGRDDPQGAVLAQAEGDEATRRIRALLPAEQAEIVLLRVVAGLSVAEVAEIVGRRPAAVSVIQHRALRRLARDLDPARREHG
jgi:RNA polymerase sigma-70 factor (ECF subfamily)